MILQKVKFNIEYINLSKLLRKKVPAELIFFKINLESFKIPTYQVTKLPSFQVTKLPSYQFTKVLSYQFTKVLSYQVTKLLTY